MASTFVFLDYHHRPRWRNTPEDQAFFWEHVDDDGPWWYWPCCNQQGKKAQACKSTPHLSQYRFGETLRTLRTKQGLEVQDLAAELICSEETVARLENGETRPDARQLFIVSKFFDVPQKILVDEEIWAELFGEERRRVEDAIRRQKWAKSRR